jgi:hypothetical protein
MTVRIAGKTRIGSRDGSNRRVIRNALGSLCAIFLLLSLLASCSGKKSTNPVCLQSTQGTIRGRIITGGGELGSIRVAAEPINGAAPNFAWATVPVDSLGRFELTLPLGTYVLRPIPEGVRTYLYYADGGLTTIPARAKTISLVLGGQIVEADLLGGSLHIRVRFPPETEDEQDGSVTLHLESLDPPYVWAGVSVGWSANVVDGIAEVDIPFLPALDYSLSFQSSYGEEVWLRGGNVEDNTDRITVSNGQVTICNVDLGIPGRLQGRIESDLPLAHEGRVLSLFSADSVRLAQVLLREDRGFRIGLYHPEPVRLCFWMGGIWRWFGGDSFSSATLIDLAPGQLVDGIEIRDGGFRITLEGPGVWSYHHARLNVVDGSGRALSSTPVALSESEGSIVSNIASGSYYLQVIPEDDQIWLPQWYESADSMQYATPLVIPPEGGLVDATFHLRAGGSLAGRVTREDASVVGQIELFLSSLTDSTAVLRRASAHVATGAFRFVGLSDGDYRLGVAWYRVPMRWYPGVADWRAAGVLSIRNHGEVVGVDWRIPR